MRIFISNRSYIQYYVKTKEIFLKKSNKIYPFHINSTVKSPKLCPAKLSSKINSIQNTPDNSKSRNHSGQSCFFRRK